MFRTQKRRPLEPPVLLKPDEYIVFREDFDPRNLDHDTLIYDFRQLCSFVTNKEGCILNVGIRMDTVTLFSRHRAMTNMSFVIKPIKH